MARLPRLFVPGVPCHLIVRGNNRQSTFLSEGDFIYFHRCLADLHGEAEVAIHAYVLMTNHVHLLATGTHPGAIPGLVQRLGRRYVGYFNYLHDRTGTLWEGRYKSTLVETERYLITCQRYIELNPVRAGMVGHPARYRWSSYQCNAEGAPDSAVTPHAELAALGGTEDAVRDAYRELFENDIDAHTLAAIRDSVQNGWALGSEAFRQALIAQGARRPARTRIGRPTQQLELT